MIPMGKTQTAINGAAQAGGDPRVSRRIYLDGVRFGPQHLISTMGVDVHGRNDATCS
jgi:hypothetical protein